jgi:hypothetical protein
VQRGRGRGARAISVRDAAQGIADKPRDQFDGVTSVGDIEERIRGHIRDAAGAEKLAGTKLVKPPEMTIEHGRPLPDSDEQATRESTIAQVESDSEHFLAEDTKRFGNVLNADDARFFSTGTTGTLRSTGSRCTRQRNGYGTSCSTVRSGGCEADRNRKRAVLAHGMRRSTTMERSDIQEESLAKASWIVSLKYPAWQAAVCACVAKGWRIYQLPL